MIEIAQIAREVGTFANFVSRDGKSIGKAGIRRSFFAKKMLAQLQPAPGWETSSVTELTVPLAEQEPAVIEITGTRRMWGGGELKVSKKTLAQLADSARIVTSPDLLPAAFYLKIVAPEFRSKIMKQDRRCLREILGKKDYANWKKDFQNLGFNTVEAFEASADLPINCLASAACHSQEVHFFVEQHKLANGRAVNKLRKAALDKACANVLLSVPGLNIAYGGEKRNKGIYNEIDPKYFRDGTAKKLITHMWQVVLIAAVNQNCRHLIFPAIGLGAFLPPHWAEKKKRLVASLYYDSLMELLSLPQFKDQFDSIYINPVFEFARTALEQSKEKYAIAHVYAFQGDVKFLAIELAKKGYRCGLLNPSDPDVILAKNDVGQYYKEGHYAGEEDFIATSTGCLGSVGISDVYTNKAKVSSVILSKPSAPEIAHKPLQEISSPALTITPQEEIASQSPMTASVAIVVASPSVSPGASEIAPSTIKKSFIRSLYEKLPSIRMGCLSCKRKKSNLPIAPRQEVKALASISPEEIANICQSTVEKMQPGAEIDIPNNKNQELIFRGLDKALKGKFSGYPKVTQFPEGFNEETIPKIKDYERLAAAFKA